MVQCLFLTFLDWDTEYSGDVSAITEKIFDWMSWSNGVQQYKRLIPIFGRLLLYCCLNHSCLNSCKILHLYIFQETLILVNKKLQHKKQNNTDNLFCALKQQVFSMFIYTLFTFFAAEHNHSGFISCYCVWK